MSRASIENRDAEYSRHRRFCSCKTVGARRMRVKQIMPRYASFSASVMVGFERRTPSYMHIHAYGDERTKVGSLFGDDKKCVASDYSIYRNRDLFRLNMNQLSNPPFHPKLLYNICLEIRSARCGIAAMAI